MSIDFLACDLWWVTASLTGSHCALPIPHMLPGWHDCYLPPCPILCCPKPRTLSSRKVSSAGRAELLSRLSIPICILWCCSLFCVGGTNCRRVRSLQDLWYDSALLEAMLWNLMPLSSGCRGDYLLWTLLASKEGLESLPDEATCLWELPSLCPRCAHHPASK